MKTFRVVLIYASLLLFGGSCNLIKKHESQWPNFAPELFDTLGKVVRIDSSIFMDEAEVNNLKWRLYTQWISKHYGTESQKYKASLPDTNVWKKSIDYGEPLTKYYFRHAAYNYYPVVCLTHKQAVDYCNWRTQQLNAIYRKKDYQNVGITSSYYPLKVICRLPTEKEWKKAARIGNDRIEKKMNSDLIRLRYGFLQDNPDIPSPVYSFMPNKYGLYNILGNVAEMTQTKGKIMGSAYTDSEKLQSANTKRNIDSTANWIGFRCVIEIVKE